MRLAFLAAGLGLLITAPLHAQPIIVPAGPQPQRQPPPPPPPSPVPVAPAQGAAGSQAGQEQGRPPIVFNGGTDQQLGTMSGPSDGASRGTAEAPAQRP